MSANLLLNQEAFKKNNFLNDPDVVEFIRYLANNLKEIHINLRVTSSKFVPNGINKRMKGIEDVVSLYYWEARWRDHIAGRWIYSSTWETTRESLALLRLRLIESLDKDNNQDALLACKSVLQWGGVSGAIKFLDQLAIKKQLITYLRASQRLFRLDGAQSLDEINEKSILRFDSGMTKIHALLDDSGSPIYDSRVGAAVAMLYAMYRETADVPAALTFPSGAARGQQIRNPGDLNFDYSSAPQFYTKRLPPHEWARWQVKLGWIIRSVLEKTSLFEGNDLASRCHSFEAALFMLGYDLRNFVIKDEVVKPLTRGKVTALQPAVTKWVPSSHPFIYVLKTYLDFRTRVGSKKPGLNKYREHLVLNCSKNQSTARAYCFPLTESEFDFEECTVNELEAIVNSSSYWERLNIAYGDSKFRLGDEREQVCLVNVYLTGKLQALYGSSNSLKKSTLRNIGFAGTEKSAQTLLYVGENVGKHFGLLDESKYPTDLFESFFGDELIDFDEILKKERR